MNYFPFHVGDYVASTAHLSWDEDMAYTRLIRVYYQTEKPIPKDKAYRLARATTPAQKAAVDSVLDEFFTLDADAYRQDRCDEEIAKFADKQSKAKRSANARWKPTKENTEGNANASETHMRTHNEGNANQEPITNNQEPNTRHAVVIEEGSENQRVSIQGAICMVIKAEGISAVNPQHPEFLALIDQGADVGHFASAAKTAREKGKGFAYLLGIVKGQMADAVNLANAAHLSRGTGPAPPESFKERDARIGRERWEQMTGQIHPDNIPKQSENVIDITPKFLEIST